MINRTETLKAAHRIATQIFCDENIKYRKALSKALKIVYHNFRLIKNANNDLTSSEKELIVKSNGSLKIETIQNHKFVNMDLVGILKKYSCKSWKYFGGYEMNFSNELINNLT